MPALPNPVPRALVLLALAFGAVAAAPANAASYDQEFCVTSNVQLANALVAADDDDTLIKLAVGTYDVKDTWLDRTAPSRPLSIDQTVILRGGYSSDCSSRSDDARSTVLTNSNGTGIDLRVDDDVQVDFLTFRNVGEPVTVNSARSAGTATTFHEAVFDRVILDRTRAAFFADDRVALHQVLSFKAPGSSSSCAIFIEAVNDVIPDLEDILVSQTTVADSAGKGLCIHDAGSADVVIENSIFWNSLNADLDVASTASNTLYSNTWFSGGVGPAPISESGTLHGNPLFQNTSVDDYQLDFLPTISPAINSGDNYTNSQFDTTDVWGQPRHIGSKIDRGPLESIIDDSLVIPVTNTSDNAVNPANGSLRKAINTANSAGGYHAITFDLPGGCDQHIIDVATPLPAISSDMVINGYSQTGASKNTHANLSTNAVICVGIRGNVNTDTGLRVAGGNPRVEISGLAFGGFDVAAVQLSSGHNHVVWGNQFGGSVGGVSLGNSAVNVALDGSAQAVQVGGDDRTQLNLIGSAYDLGIRIANTSGSNRIVGNLIGAGANGTSANPNQFGVWIASSYNTVRDNVISANQYNGVMLSGASALHNSITDNAIGVKGGLVICFPAPCTPNYALGNGLNGVLVTGGASQNSINSNHIAYNGARGVFIDQGDRNRMLSNSIHDNQELGVDLGTVGVDSWNNDVSVIGPANRGINFPYALSAIGARHNGVVHGVIHSINAAYVVQAYANASCDASGFGEGRTLVGTGLYSVTDAGSSNGNTYFDLPISWSQDLSGPGGRNITLQVMDEDGHSSEFGNCATYTCDTIFRHGLEGTVAESCP